MKKIILVLFILTGLVTTAQEKKNKNAKHTITVSGNCEQCQKRIQKAALSVSGVKLATWNVETQQLSLLLNEEKCSLNDVQKAVSKVGHDAGPEKAPKDSYDKLPACCKYGKETSKH